MAKKIIFFTHGKVNPHKESGMSRIVYYRAKYLMKKGVDFEIISVWDEAGEMEIYERDFLTIKLFPRIYHPLSPKKKILLEYFQNIRKEIGMVDFHLMWFYDKYPLANFLKKNGIPYVVTAHGAYSKDKIEVKKWKKIPAKLLYELPFLNKSSGVIAQTPEELSELRFFGVKSKIYLSSIGIEKEEIPEQLGPSKISEFNDLGQDTIKLGWVGNIVPIKNLHNLIKALAFLPEEILRRVKLFLVGPTQRDKKYFAYLKELIEEENLTDKVFFLGPLYKEEKFAFLRDIDCYIHVSTSETISLAVLEAMAMKKPLIISRTSQVSYLYNEGFFIMVEPWYDHIALGISAFFKLSPEERRKMGEKAYKIAFERFSWDKVIEGYLEIYEDILKQHV